MDDHPLCPDLCSEFAVLCLVYRDDVSTSQLTRGTTLVADCVIALSGTHMLSFTFLRRKAIGYFLVATLLPVVYLRRQTYRLPDRFTSAHRLSFGLLGRMRANKTTQLR